jgi:3-deoxy-D-manno-octulosonate 8-phosphate phosphatase (KDO 8-P phosphatase)
VDTQQDNLNVEQRAARVKLLLLDCDGVLTDGRITLLENGDEEKSFHTRDGHGLVLLHRAGLQSGIISGRTSSAVERRARDLGITYVRQGTWDKIKDFAEVLAAAATADTRAAAHYTTSLSGGFGAVREVCELILKAQGRWPELMRRYVGSDE